MADSSAQVIVHVKNGNRTISALLVLPEEELDDVTVLFLKQKVGDMLRPMVQPEDLSCHIDGADLDDHWVGLDFGLMDGTALEFATNSEVSNLKFKGTSSGYGPSGQPSPVTLPNPPEEVKTNKIDLNERPPWGANQPRGTGGRGNGWNGGDRSRDRDVPEVDSPRTIERKERRGPSGPLPSSARRADGGEGKRGPSPPTLSYPLPQGPKPIGAFIPPAPSGPLTADLPPPPPPPQAPPPPQSYPSEQPYYEEGSSTFEAEYQMYAAPLQDEDQVPPNEYAGWGQTLDRAKAEGESSATAMAEARAKAAAAIQAAEALDSESLGGLSSDGEGRYGAHPKTGTMEPSGDKMRRRLELLDVFAEISEQPADGERLAEVEKLAEALQLSTDPVLARCFNEEEVQLEGGLTWEHCLHILHMQEPPITDNFAVPVNEVASRWFGRDITTVVMDVAIQDRDFEISVTDDTKPEEVAQTKIKEHRIESRFLNPLTEQIRATALHVNREELHHVRVERDQLLLDMLRIESVLVDRERRAASLLFNLDGKSGKRTVLELTNQIASLQEKLALAQANSTLVAQISASTSEGEQAAKARASHKFRLETIYALSAPEKLPTVENTLEKFRGHEDTLFEMVETKYGPVDLGKLGERLRGGGQVQDSGDAEAEFKGADLDGDGQISKAEWRKYNAEKQKLMREANEDRERLMNENRRLRSALNPDSLRAVEKERERSKELHALEVRNGELEIRNRELEKQMQELKVSFAQDQAAAFSLLQEMVTDLQASAASDPVLNGALLKSPAFGRASLEIEEA